MKKSKCFRGQFDFEPGRFVYQKPPTEGPKEQGEKHESPKKTPNETKKEEQKAKVKEKYDKLEKIEKIDLPKETEFFRSKDGKTIAYVVFGEGLFISKDGKTFYELVQMGFNGSGVEHKLTFENPHNKTEGEFNRKGDTLKLGSETYAKTSSRTSIDAVRLPEVRQEEYSFTLKSGEKLTVTSDKYKFSYESFKLFIGNKEIPIKDVQRMRDGGTTYIKTDEGLLYAPINPTEKPTWKGEEIKQNNIR